MAGIVFNKIYFPDFDPTVGTVLAFATFAVGFVARPLGGIVFGHFGDKLGRKKMLVLTLEIMGVATVGIGLVPSYESIGILAPILLVLCRLAQGIGIGGEWGGAVLMAFESAPPHKRAFYGSLPQVGLALGLMLASGVIGLLSFFLSDEAFLAWGWRVAFILSAILVGVAGGIINSSKPMRWGRYRSWLVVIPWLIPLIYPFQFVKIGDGVISGLIIMAAAIISHTLWQFPYVASISMIST